MSADALKDGFQSDPGRNGRFDLKVKGSQQKKDSAIRICTLTYEKSIGGGRIRRRSAERLNDNPDVKVALLDVMLPGIDGFEVCRRIRATNTKIGIIMLTARAQEMDKITGLMTGADDYVTKPFPLGADCPRTRCSAGPAAMWRRCRRGKPGSIPAQHPQPHFGKNGKRIKLTQVEYTIMKMFMENPGKALSREEILDMVWGHDYFGEVKIVDVNIRRLRLKIEDNPQNPTYITTVWGVWL